MVGGKLGWEGCFQFRPGGQNWAGLSILWQVPSPHRSDDNSWDDSQQWINTFMSTLLPFRPDNWLYKSNELPEGRRKKLFATSAPCCRPVVLISPKVDYPLMGRWEREFGLPADVRSTTMVPLQVFFFSQVPHAKASTPPHYKRIIVAK